MAAIIISTAQEVKAEAQKVWQTKYDHCSEPKAMFRKQVFRYAAAVWKPFPVHPSYWFDASKHDI